MMPPIPVRQVVHPKIQSDSMTSNTVDPTRSMPACFGTDEAREHLQHAALSCCRGTSDRPAYVTTKSPTSSSRCASSDTADVPRTIQRAFRIRRELNHRYPWVRHHLHHPGLGDRPARRGRGRRDGSHVPGLRLTVDGGCFDKREPQPQPDRKVPPTRSASAVS
jgi:hypothetical protein